MRTKMMVLAFTVVAIATSQNVRVKPEDSRTGDWYNGRSWKTLPQDIKVRLCARLVRIATVQLQRRNP